MFFSGLSLRRRLLIPLILLAFVYLLYHHVAKTLPPDSSETDPLDLSRAAGFLPIHEARQVCQDRAWRPYFPRDQRRKIYDMFLINTELEWLEIRLTELEDEVDYFVVLEAPLSFTGLPKPLHIKDNWELFSRWHHKMIYHTLNETGERFTDTWGHEAFQRNGLLTQMLATFNDTAHAPRLYDVGLVSDVDEVPRASTLRTLRNCQYPRTVTLGSAFYYYSFQWRHRGHDWLHPQATYYEGPEKTLLPDDLRRSQGARHWLFWWHHPTPVFPNAAWHCSSCFPKLEDMVNKITSFSHTKWNKPEFRDRHNILQRVRHGLDLFRRRGEVYDRIDNNHDIPKFLLEGGAERKKKFEYLLDRDGETGGFTDWTEADAVPAAPTPSPEARGLVRSEALQDHELW